MTSKNYAKKNPFGIILSYHGLRTTDPVVVKQLNKEVMIHEIIKYTVHRYAAYIHGRVCR